MKKLLCFVLIFTFCLPSAIADETATATEPPDIKSATAVVMDINSGQILYQKDKDVTKAPASITKLMTALLVFEKGGSLDDTITVDDSSLENLSGTTRIGLVAGEEVTVRDMLYGMLFNSANDAANVLAQYVSGSQEDFVGKMNSKASDLGCTNTKFVNANGLDADGQVTTAYDMALIGQALYQYEDFLTIIHSQSYSMDATNKEESRTFTSKINFLFDTSQYYDADVIGAKTGWTTNAHHTLVTFVKRDNRKLVVVNLDCTSKYQKFQDVLDMLNYCFNSLQAVTVSAKNLYSAACKALSDKNTTPKESSFTDQTVYLPQGSTVDSLSYSFSGGEHPTGVITYTDGEKNRQDLISFSYSLKSTSSEKNSKQNSSQKSTKKSLFGMILKIVIVLFLVWLGFYAYIIHVNRERVRRRQRRKHNKQYQNNNQK